MLVTLLTLSIACVLNSLAIVGLQGAAHEGDVLHPVLEWLQSHIGTMATKPILGCPKCMASVWGGLPMACLLVTQHYHPVTIVLYAVAYTCLASGVVRIISLFMDYLDK